MATAKAGMNKLESIYDLVPKIEYKGSSVSGSPSISGGQTNTGVRWDDDRLFATYDEVLYRHKVGYGPREENDTFTNNAISRKKLDSCLVVKETVFILQKCLSRGQILYY